MIQTHTVPALPETLTDFAPVPRQQTRQHGWSPGRQKAFIEALAETASVRRASEEVNMTRISAYQLRNHPQGGEFRKAWDAAIDFALAMLKDTAFERAVEGQLEPVFQKGELMGYRRKFSDPLLMFLLRQYGNDGPGRRVTVNYVSARAGTGGGIASAEAEAGSVSVHTSREQSAGIAPESAADIMGSFAGVTLDGEAEEAIAVKLKDCATLQRRIDGTLEDARTPFVMTSGQTFVGNSFEPSPDSDAKRRFAPDEPPWERFGRALYVPPHEEVLETDPPLPES
jgi:hypothetical protein